MPPALFQKQSQTDDAGKAPVAPTYDVGPVVGSTSTLWVRSGVRRGAREFRHAVSLVTLRPDIPPSPERRRDFEHALASFARVHHPAVLRIDDISEMAGRTFAAAPPLTGNTLARFLAGPVARVRPMSAALAANIVCGVAAGVESLRATQPSPVALAHLSPDSVWLTSTGEALVLPNVAFAARPAGSPEGDIHRYRAPEREPGHPGYSRSDVYSLALLFWDILARGRSVLPGRTNIDGWPLRRAVDERVVKLVLRSLSVDPGVRPANPGAFGAELATLVGVSTPRHSTASAHTDPTVEIDADEIDDVETPDPETVRAPAVAPPRNARMLHVVRGEAVPRELSLNGAPRRWIVGRARTADLAVHDPDVSRKHFEIVRDADGTLRILDLGSKNGLFVNGVSVRNLAVGPGDEVHAGTTILRFEP